MYSRHTIVRHVLFSLFFVVLYLLLNKPEIVVFSRIGLVAWYPAIGLVMAVTLGVSPWYALLVCFSDALANRIIYAQPVLSFSGTVDAAGIALCYGVAAHVLRGPLRIDLGLRRRRDVVHYLLVSAIAAGAATIIGVACLIADHSVTWHDRQASTIGWFLGDAIGIVGIAPFLLIQVLPTLRNWLSATSVQPHPTTSRAGRRSFSLATLAEVSGQGLTIAAVLWVMFGTKDGRYDHFYESGKRR